MAAGEARRRERVRLAQLINRRRVFHCLLNCLVIFFVLVFVSDSDHEHEPRTRARLFLPGLPNFKCPLLHFFLLFPHGGIGVGEGVLFAEAAPLCRQNFAEGYVVAQ